LSTADTGGDWRSELARRITDPAHLPPGFVLQGQERAFFAVPAPGRAGGSRLPFAVTRHYACLADPADVQDPIRRQFLPRLEELERGPGELRDPLGEADCQPVPRLLHRYPDRALLLVTDLCATYCRHCFRRGTAGQAGWVLTAAEAGAAAAYVASHREIRELILSGGDPLVLGDPALETILRVFRAARPGLALRIHTRLPVMLPARLSEPLVDLLRRYRPLRLVTQINHPHEMSPATRAALQRLGAAGIPLLNQAVLLRGVNDRLETLVELMRTLGETGVRPYYLFQPDLAEGTAHFRPPLRTSLELVAALRRRLPRRLLPAYAVDLPGGGGKVRLDGRRPLLRDGYYLLRGPRGLRTRFAPFARYPAD
jgi:lysine 2,3-aminomutase